jgi:hypothetical protein
MKGLGLCILVVYLMSGNGCKKEEQVPDTQDPIISITSPRANQKTISGDTIYIDILYQDNTIIDSVLFTSLDITDKDSTVLMESDTIVLKALSYKYFKKIVYNVESPRKFELYFWAKDTAGNVSDTTMLHEVILPE